MVSIKKTNLFCLLFVYIIYSVHSNTLLCSYKTRVFEERKRDWRENQNIYLFFKSVSDYFDIIIYCTLCVLYVL